MIYYRNLRRPLGMIPKDTYLLILFLLVLIHSIGMCSRMCQFLAVLRIFFHSSLLYTPFHELVFHPPSLHLAIYFLVYLSALLLQIHVQYFIGNSISSILSACPQQ